MMHNLYTDQNCIVYVDQSSNGVNTDHSHEHNAYAGIGAGITDGLTARYVQLRVENVGLAATTVVRLQAALTPIGNPLPSNLSDEGNFKVGVYEIEGDTGARTLVTPSHELKTTSAVRLVGTTLFDALAPQFWLTTVVGSGTVTTGGGQTTLATGVTIASSALLYTTDVARYVGGTSNHFYGVIRAPAAVGANVRRWGAFTPTNGCFFEADNVLGFAVVTRRAGVDTRVATGAFNGVLGVSYILDANVHTWEIIWQNGTCWFFLDGDLLHTVAPTAAPWANTLHLPAAAQNANGANINNVDLEVRSIVINRLGPVPTVPTYRRLNALGTYVLKSSPGALHAVILGNLPTAVGTITFYDNTVAAGEIIAVLTLTRLVTSALPTTVDFRAVEFSIGLTVVIAGAASDITVLFE